MTLPSSAAEHYRTQQSIAGAAVLAARRAWALMGRDFDVTWPRVSGRVVLVTTAAQLAAARSGAGYVPDVLEETRQVAPAVGAVRPERFAGVAGDGRSLEGLFYGAVTAAKVARAPSIFTEDGVTTMLPGVGVDEALARGGRWLDMAVQTAVADADRAAVSTSITSRPALTGYVRMLNPPSCSRCAVLAGRLYRWNTGFDRHPRCDCRHIPASESVAGDLTTDPKAYFASLDAAQQERIFTKAGAQAVRDGADVGQVVNARRGMETAVGPAGRRRQVRNQNGLYTTTEGSTRRRGRPPRLMPESLYEVAVDRDDAIRLLRVNGYIT